MHAAKPTICMGSNPPAFGWGLTSLAEAICSTGMTDEPEDDQSELIPAPPADAARKDRLAAILRGETPGKGGKRGVSEQRKLNTQRETAERDSMKKSLRGPR